MGPRSLFQLTFFTEQGIERTDDDYQLDDVFMSRAAGLQSEAKINEREKLTAVLGQFNLGSSLCLPLLLRALREHLA